jgi:hypothetical protein
MAQKQNQQTEPSTAVGCTEPSAVAGQTQPEAPSINFDLALPRGSVRTTILILHCADCDKEHRCKF